MPKTKIQKSSQEKPRFVANIDMDQYGLGPVVLKTGYGGRLGAFKRLQLKDQTSSPFVTERSMTTRDVEYYRRRERQEREYAEKSRDNSARCIHLEMARRYSAMLRDVSLIPVMVPA